MIAVDCKRGAGDMRQPDQKQMWARRFAVDCNLPGATFYFCTTPELSSASGHASRIFPGRRNDAWAASGDFW
jgi:hypothetical protein